MKKNQLMGVIMRRKRRSLGECCCMDSYNVLFLCEPLLMCKGCVMMMTMGYHVDMCGNARELVCDEGDEASLRYEEGCNKADHE